MTSDHTRSKLQPHEKNRGHRHTDQAGDSSNPRSRIGPTSDAERDELPTRGGEPVVDGLRVAVRRVVTLHQRGEAILDIAEALNITEAQVFHALSYFFDHRDEIMAWPIRPVVRRSSSAALRIKALPSVGLDRRPISPAFTFTCEHLPIEAQASFELPHEPFVSTLLGWLDKTDGNPPSKRLIGFPGSSVPFS
jgi:uncharacterized protein (DUF433 family)